MPTRPRIPALVFLLGLPAVTSLGAEDPVPALLQRQTQELVDAVGSGDVAVWNRYLDPEVRFVDEEGTVSTKAQMLEQIRPLPQGVSGSIRVADFDAVVRGDVAVATYVNEESENYHGHPLHCR